MTYEGLLREWSFNIVLAYKAHSINGIKGETLE